MERRLVRAPKLALADTGLLASLLGVDDDRLRSDGALLGTVLENFVVMELHKQLGWSRRRPQLFHLRTHTGPEVDVVLEEPGGALVGIEVKASASIGAGDFRGLRALAEIADKRFRRGIVLYPGRESWAAWARSEGEAVAEAGEGALRPAAEAWCATSGTPRRCPPPAPRW